MAVLPQCNSRGEPANSAANDENGQRPESFCCGIE